MADNGHDIYRTEEEVINALYETGGNINATASLLKIGSKPLRERIRRNPELKDAMLEAREQDLDLAEGIVHNAMKRGNKNVKLETAKWYLQRKGRNRGYGDVTTNINANLNANYDLSKIPLDERMKLLETINGARADDN